MKGLYDWKIISLHLTSADCYIREVPRQQDKRKKISSIEIKANLMSRLEEFYCIEFYWICSLSLSSTFHSFCHSTYYRN